MGGISKVVVGHGEKEEVRQPALSFFPPNRIPPTVKRVVMMRCGKEKK